MLTQAAIEEALQMNQPLVGIVSDIQRAFDATISNLSHCTALGLPANFIFAWATFLFLSETFFVVRTECSAPMTTTCGFPQGCALSCTAMLLLNFCYHTWMKVYSPSVLALTFVDNYELLARSVRDLAHGLATQLSFLDMVQLDLDARKTYSCSALAPQRRQLAEFAHRVAFVERDLGGAMTYRRQRSSATTQLLIDALQGSWTL